MDGSEVQPPIEHRVNPGEHAILAKRGEAVVYERRVTLPESASVEVEIDAPTTLPPSAPKTVPASNPDVLAPHSSGMSPLPFYIGGGVLAAGAIVSFVIASSVKDSVADNCAAQRSLTCNVDEAGGSRVRTWETVGWLSGGLAVAAVGVGIVIHARGGSKPSATSVVRPSVGAFNGFVWEGQF